MQGLPEENKHSLLNDGIERKKERINPRNVTVSKARYKLEQSLTNIGVGLGTLK